ncbi:multiple epidermal growth factor-like domains protein 6 [Denticeps clupeoides]|uniref:multiple epidermal growth factor-like domains protein 6 n=1 Tax=Denticeps clupeoides TaxID=299321 RepID=UPI0010A47628|nr:multiple epidermal growth factor-like domains protein 6 [Denticeps clupeoides]
MDTVWTWLLVVIINVINAASQHGRDLKPNMPNVCTEQEVKLVAHKQPCVQTFTRMVKVWKQGCTGQSWCMGYERRTAYYTAYRQVYRQDQETVHKCCPGWSQLNGEAGCLYPVCSYGVCFNGGVCREGSAQLCDCPVGFNGPSCQYGCVFWKVTLRALGILWWMDPGDLEGLRKLLCDFKQLFGNIIP